MRRGCWRWAAARLPGMRGVVPADAAGRGRRASDRVAGAARPATSASRRRVLARGGRRAAPLHDAACYLDGRDPTAALAVRHTPGVRPTVLLAEAERVRPLRRPHPGRARRDLAAVERALAAAGCGRADRRRFLAGYRRSAPGDATGASPPPRWPGYRTADATPAARRLRNVRVACSRPIRRSAPPRPPLGSFWSRLWRGAARLRQRPDWPRFAGPDWPDRIMDVAVTDRFHAKQGRSTGRWVLHADGPGAGTAGRLPEAPLPRRGGTGCWRRCGRAAAGRPPFRSGNIWNGRGRVGVPVPRGRRRRRVRRAVRAGCAASSPSRSCTTCCP